MQRACKNYFQHKKRASIRKPGWVPRASTSLEETKVKQNQTAVQLTVDNAMNISMIAKQIYFWVFYVAHCTPCHCRPKSKPLLLLNIHNEVSDQGCLWWWDQQHVIGWQEAKGADMEVWHHLRYSHDFYSASCCSFAFHIPTKLKDQKEELITGWHLPKEATYHWMWLVAMEPRDTVMSSMSASTNFLWIGDK